MLEEADLFFFIHCLMNWAEFLERVERGLFFKVLTNMVEVAGWTYSDWNKIHVLLTAAEGSK